jgi:hypothetical protein
VINLDNLSTLTSFNSPNIWNVVVLLPPLSKGSRTKPNGTEAKKSIQNLPFKYDLAISFTSKISLPDLSIIDVLKLMTTSSINQISTSVLKTIQAGFSSAFCIKAIIKGI